MRAPSSPDYSSVLFAEGGQRKYLSAPERTRFYDALDRVDAVTRTFCEMLYWTGCRPSEALAMTEGSIDLDSGYVVIRSLKKRGNLKGRHYRIVPLPRVFLERLRRAHGLSRKRRVLSDGGECRLWPFSRTTGWKRVAAVMGAAGITDDRACARGLRHGFGVHAALMGVPETRIQKWLGHANLTTTGIYLDMAALEDREMARRTWRAAAMKPTEANDGQIVAKAA